MHRISPCHVLDQIEQKYNTAEDPYYIWENGLQVYTTLDWNLQVYAECVSAQPHRRRADETAQAVPGWLAEPASSRNCKLRASRRSPDD